MNLTSYEAVLFDLDNTIYNETDYLFRAYSDIALMCSSQYGINYHELYDYLIDYFIRNGRQHIFNSFCENFHISISLMDDFLAIMRGVVFEEKISCFPYFTPLVRKLDEANVRLGIITNGNVKQQMNKIRNIDFSGFLDKIVVVYANEWSPKPSPISYEKMKEFINFKSSVYIGDLDMDEQFAKNAGFPFLNVSLLRREELGFI